MVVSCCSEMFVWNGLVSFKKLLALTFVEVTKSCTQSYENWNSCMKSSGGCTVIVLFVLS